MDRFAVLQPAALLGIAVALEGAALCPKTVRELDDAAPRLPKLAAERRAVNQGLHAANPLQLAVVLLKPPVAPPHEHLAAPQASHAVEIPAVLEARPARETPASTEVF